MEIKLLTTSVKFAFEYFKQHRFHAFLSWGFPPLSHFTSLYWWIAINSAQTVTNSCLYVLASPYLETAADHCDSWIDGYFAN